MWPISEGCRAALKTDHSLDVVAEVYDGFRSLIASTYGTPRIEMLGDGAITVERKALHTRVVSFSVIDTDGALIPTFEQRYLDPLYRPQVQFYFDVGWADETGDHVERIPAGRFALDDNDAVEREGGALMQCTGTGRSSALVSQNPWTSPFPIPDGITWDAAIKLALGDRCGLTIADPVTALSGWSPIFRFSPSTALTPKGIVLGGDSRSDPWAELQKFAEGDGKELIEDATGGFVLRPIPTTAGAVVWHYDETEESTALGSMHRKMRVADVYNGVIVRCSAPWLLFPVTGVAWDTDPFSPTYYLGPFGMKPKLIDDAIASTVGQANAAAAVHLGATLGLVEEMPFDALTNPAHDPGDVVSIGSEALAVTDVALLDSFTLPFDVGRPMTVVVRRTRNG